MASLRVRSVQQFLCAFLLSPLLLGLSPISSVSESASGDPLLKQRPGDNVTLLCWGPAEFPIALLDWSRPELKKDGYVFFYRDGKVYPSQQHELYRGRVQLRDPLMRDGDASVILRDVSLNDSGTYVCRMFIDTGPGPKPQQTHNVTLKVTENTRGSADEPNPNPSGLVVGLFVAVFLIVIVVIFLYKRYKRPDERGAVPVPNEPRSEVLFRSEEPVEQT